MSLLLLVLFFHYAVVDCVCINRTEKKEELNESRQAGERENFLIKDEMEKLKINFLSVFLFLFVRTLIEIA